MADVARRDPDVPDLGRGERQHRCHECGEPIRGIEARAPGEHRFTGCGHRATARFTRPVAEADSTLAGVRHR
ncbi:MAG: hypothetical protein ABEI39_00445 [Halobacteriales archaeon]